ncbi:MAG: type II toxin-antitoxin system VapC family toxin [Thermoguttaceae bacterium]|jgi:predicted nucleic acid-binding protein
MPSKARIYWDSCVYISCIEKTPDRYPILQTIIREAQAGSLVLVASTLVIAEVVRLNGSTEPEREQANRIQEFFENDYIEIRAVDRLTAEYAAEISRTHGLKPPDAIHVATAIHHKCDCLQTYDGQQGCRGKLLALNGKIGWPALSIQLPSSLPKQERLFDS